jgi:hypothetical protein
MHRTTVIRIRFALCMVVTLALAACVDAPAGDPEPQSRLLASWDPLDCGDEPHRVVVELEDEAGVPLAHSAPCEIGGLSIDIPHWGVYLGRVYAWFLGPEIRAVAPARVDIDAPVVQWVVETPR